MHRHAAGQLGDRLIANKTGFRNNNFIAGLYQRTDGQVDGFTAAHRNQNLRHIVFQVKPAFQIPADLGAQFFQACVGCVFGAALFQAADARITHTPGRFEVRLAHAQRDAVGHVAGQVKELADAGRAHGLGAGCKQFVIVHHSIVHSLSSVSSA